VVRKSIKELHKPLASPNAVESDPAKDIHPLSALLVVFRIYIIDVRKINILRNTKDFNWK
jgi:hypothetical protein